MQISANAYSRGSLSHAGSGGSLLLAILSTAPLAAQEPLPARSIAALANPAVVTVHARSAGEDIGNRRAFGKIDDLSEQVVGQRLAGSRCAAP